jgi:hypothetical protein
MSYAKASKKEEREFKEYTTAKAEIESEPGKVDVKALEKDLASKGVPYSQFLVADETWRKRALKEDYAATKLKHGWLYDQPIKADV